MATATTDADEIRRQMAQIRHDLHHDVQGVVAGAEAVTDWHRYLRNYPWLAMGAAVTVGYLLVPRRHQPKVIVTTPAPAEPLVSKTEEKPEEKNGKGLMSMAWGILGPVAIRAAQGYAVNYLENWILQQQQGSKMAPPGPTSNPSRPAEPGHSAGLG